MDFRGLIEFLKDTFMYILVVVVVLFLVIYVISLQQVIGPSMKPTLNSNDILVLNKLHYKIFDVKRNDVIAFDNEDTKFLVKRVIGLPGESILYKDNVLYVNNDPVLESFTEEETEDFDLSSLGYEIVPEDMYLVLGDNRSNSEDSRVLGLIGKKDIIGKALVKIWPLKEIKIIK